MYTNLVRLIAELVSIKRPLTSSLMLSIFWAQQFKQQWALSRKAKIVITDKNCHDFNRKHILTCFNSLTKSHTKTARQTANMLPPLSHMSKTAHFFTVDATVHLLWLIQRVSLHFLIQMKPWPRDYWRPVVPEIEKSAALWISGSTSLLHQTLTLGGMQWVNSGHKETQEAFNSRPHTACIIGAAG